jgi:hypothetical protein
VGCCSFHVPFWILYSFPLDCQILGMDSTIQEIWGRSISPTILKDLKHVQAAKSTVISNGDGISRRQTSQILEISHQDPLQDQDLNELTKSIQDLNTNSSSVSSNPSLQEPSTSSSTRTSMSFSPFSPDLTPSSSSILPPPNPNSISSNSPSQLAPNLSPQSPQTSSVPSSSPPSQSFFSNHQLPIQNGPEQQNITLPLSSLTAMLERISVLESSMSVLSSLVTEVKSLKLELENLKSDSSTLNASGVFHSRSNIDGPAPLMGPGIKLSGGLTSESSPFLNADYSFPSPSSSPKAPFSIVSPTCPPNSESPYLSNNNNLHRPIPTRNGSSNLPPPSASGVNRSPFQNFSPLPSSLQQHRHSMPASRFSPSIIMSQNQLPVESSIPNLTGDRRHTNVEIEPIQSYPMGISHSNNSPISVSDRSLNGVNNKWTSSNPNNPQNQFTSSPMQMSHSQGGVSSRNGSFGPESGRRGSVNVVGFGVGGGAFGSPNFGDRRGTASFEGSPFGDNLSISPTSARQMSWEGGSSGSQSGGGTVGMGMGSNPPNGSLSSKWESLGICQEVVRSLIKYG